MVGDESQQQLLPNASAPGTATEDTPLTDAPPEGDDGAPPAMPEIVEWSTNMLSQICRDGDIARLRLFIEYSQQMTSCGKHASEIVDRLDADTGLSPLHLAARYQQFNICFILLSNIDFQSGVNIKDGNGRTPMHFVSSSTKSVDTNVSNAGKELDVDIDIGNKIQEATAWQEEYANKILPSHHPLIYLFTKAKGFTNARDKYLLTPLHYAVSHNNFAGIQQLVLLGAQIEARDRQRISPFHLACKEGSAVIAKYLIENGANMDAKDADFWTPMHYACARGHLEIIELLKSKSLVDFQEMIRTQTNSSATCLHLAVQNGNVRCVEYILSEFKEQALTTLINQQAEPFGTPINFAAKFCDPSMINLLYRHGADPSILNTFKQSALHIACASNRLPIVQELFSLTDTSLVEIKDDQGRTALSTTTNSDIITELLTHGADITSLDINHMNALMIAVANSQLPVAEHLLYSIDDLSMSTLSQVEKRNGRSIFLLAVRRGSIDMCSLLLTNPYVEWDTIDKQRMNAFHIAAQYDHHELIAYLSTHLHKAERLTSMKSRSYSVMTDTPNSDTATYLQVAPVLRSFIDGQNEDGKTPLHIAAEQGHKSSVQALLKSGADALQPNYLGQVPLHTAIQNGHGQCVEVLIKASTKNMANFRAALSRKQSPLIAACENGFADIVRLLLSKEIGVDTEWNYQSTKRDDNPLEIAIKNRRVDTVHALLDHSHAETWLMSVRRTHDSAHQTPLREMIRNVPECVKHVFDKLIVKTEEIDHNGSSYERTTYNYKFIDDYVKDNGKLYTDYSRQLYRNHPFIIALDNEQHTVLEHPLVEQLMLRKWKLYRPLFYSTRMLTFLLLVVVTSYVLMVPAPNSKAAAKLPTPSLGKILSAMRWAIVALAGINILKILLEIVLYRGLRVPFAQLFGLVSYVTSILAFMPIEKTSRAIFWQWQLAALSTLLQWFNIAFILRSVPFIGNFIVMFESVLMNFFSLAFVILPLLIAFTIATHMMFFNHASFLSILFSVHKLSAMLIGEFDYEPLFFSKPALTAATLIFIPFISMMTIVFMNLLLGLTLGDIKSCLEHARAKASSYQIRELIYTECTLPSTAWLKSNTIEHEFVDVYAKDSIATKNDKRNVQEADAEEVNESSAHRQGAAELGKSLEILNMLCAQAKETLAKEVTLERTLRQLLVARQASDITEAS